MQFPIAIAAVLFGLNSSHSPIDSAHVNSGLTNSSASAVDTLEPSEIIIVEGQRRWYNQMWNELIGLDGEWEEFVDGQASVLRPLSDACSIGIRATWKDQVIYTPITRKGEVIVDAGWIRVDPFGQRSSTAGNGGVPDPLFLQSPGACTRSIDTTMVVHIAQEGDCWNEIPDAGNCSGGWSCSGSGSAGCTVEFVMQSNARVPSETYDVECGVGLSYSTCDDGNGKRSICIREG